MKINKKIHCPVCRSTDVIKTFRALSTHGKTVLSKKEKFIYYTCQNCNSLFLYGIKFNKQYYKKYYSFKGYQQNTKGIFERIQKFLERRNFEKKLLFINSFARKKGKLRILDVGCGNGSFLSFLDPKRFERVGLELNAEEYEAAKKKKLKVMKEDILTMKKRIGKFDVITLWHVLEHIPDPLLLFTQLKKYLKSNGVIIISTPNSNSWGRRLGKEQWFHLDAPRHIILFDKRGFHTLAKKTQLTIESSESDIFEFPLDLFWSLSSINRYLIIPFYPIAKAFSKETITYVMTS